jgi:hypothetical protein
MNEKIRVLSEDFEEFKKKVKKSRANTFQIKKIIFSKEEKGLIKAKKNTIKNSIWSSPSEPKSSKIHLDPIQSPVTKIPVSPFFPNYQDPRLNTLTSLHPPKSVKNFEITSSRRENIQLTLTPNPQKPISFQKSSRSPNSQIIQSQLHLPKDLNMINTPLNISHLSTLSSVLQDPLESLTSLNLENTNLSNKYLSVLCESLSNNRSLLFLGLARNSLSFESGKILKELLKENSNLKKLDLHWNSFKDLGCLDIFEGLCLNGTLKELDLSWNGIGKKDMKIIQKMSKCFEHFLGLAHLDLSFNYFNARECEELGKGLEKNHEILGIHFFGNDGKIDSQGFLVSSCSQVCIEESHLFSRIFQKRKTVPRVKGNCWLCEKWVEFKFIFDFQLFPEQFLQARGIFIHLDCDFYQAYQLVRTENGFELIRVVPSGLLKFFFSVPGAVFLISGYEKISLEEEITKTITYSPSLKLQVSSKLVNLLIIEGEPCNLKVSLSVFPRKPLFESTTQSIKSLKPAWSIESSIFKDLLQNFKILLPECLEFDWAQSKLPKIIKRAEDMVAVKQILQGIYMELIETFKQLAIQSANEFPSIGSNVFTEFLNECDLIDEFFSTSDLGVDWNSVIIPKKKQLFNPGNALVRYEFIELLIRISIDRFIRHKKCKTVSSSLENLISNHLSQVFPNYNIQKWRQETLFTQKVDIILKAFKPVLDMAFKCYSGKKSLPGQAAFMSLEEFKSLLFDCKIVDQSVASRDLDSFFFLSKRIEIDELFFKKHIEMDFSEFLEGFSRACDFSVILIGSFSSKLFLGCKALLEILPKVSQEGFVVPSKKVLKSLRG